MKLTKRSMALGLLVGLLAAGLVACGGDDSNDDGGGGAAGAAGATGGTGGSVGGTGGSVGGTGGATGGTGGAAGGAGGAAGGAGGAAGGTGGAAGGAGGAAGGAGGAAGGAGGSAQGSDCAHAIDFVKNVDSDGTIAGKIDPAGDADYYKMSLKKDEFYIFSTEANPDDKQDKLDTVISVFNEDGSKRIATMDDAYPRITSDSNLIYHSAEDQTVCVKIEEFSTWTGGTPKGGSDYVYKFAIGTVAKTADINNIDTEANNDIAAAQDAHFATSTQSKATFGQFYGTFADGADVDVYKFTPTADAVAVSIDFTPVGPGADGKDTAKNGNGSTEGLGMIKLTKADGTVLGMLDVSKGSDSMNIPLESGTPAALYLHVPRVNTTVGANDFYSLFQMNGDVDNPSETDDTANNALAAADALDMKVNPDDAKLKSGFILGHLPSGDKDYFKFSAAAGDSVVLACGAVRSGSGLQGATFTIKKSDDSDMQTETETDTADVVWSDNQYASPSKPAVKITAAGDYYLNVTATGQDSTNTADFYRCGIHVTTP